MAKIAAAAASTSSVLTAFIRLFRTAQTSEVQQLLSRNFNTVLIVFRLFGQCDNHLPFGAFQLPGRNRFGSQFFYFGNDDVQNTVNVFRLRRGGNSDERRVRQRRWCLCHKPESV